MTSRKDTNYFCVDEDELYNNVNKLYDFNATRPTELAKREELLKDV